MTTMTPDPAERYLVLKSELARLLEREGAILDEMDTLWFKMTNEARAAIDPEAAKRCQPQDSGGVRGTIGDPLPNPNLSVDIGD